MKINISTIILFIIPFYLMESVQGMERMKNEALSASGVNLYKIENDMKQHSHGLTESVNDLKRLSTSMTGNPNNYRMFLEAMDIQNTLYSIQSHMLNIFEAYGLPNEIFEKKIESEKEKAVKLACKPKDQLIDDLKNIMSFKIEDADLPVSHQKLKLVKVNLEG